MLRMLAAGISIEGCCEVELVDEFRSLRSFIVDKIWGAGRFAGSIEIDAMTFAGE